MGTRIGLLHYAAALAFLGCAGPGARAQDPPEAKGAEFRNLVYGKHERQKLDLLLPTGAGAKKPYPLVVWIHGGGWEAGSKSGGGPSAMLLEAGYAVASVNYRFSSQAVFPAQLHDCQSAIRYLRAHAKEYGLDGDHVGVWGASAGGHLAALLGTSGDAKDADGEPDSKESAKVQAVIDWFGPTTVAKLSPPGAPSNPVTRLLGGAPADKPELAKLADPITHASKGDAPTLIVHGTADPLVPLSQSESLEKALKKVGVPVELVVFEGAGHGDGAFLKEVSTEAHREKVLAFLARHLKPKPGE